MANTTNYNWETPDDTDLVKDGAAAIRTLGSSVDTTTKALNPSTTLGDIEYRSATANTNTRLGIGTTGQVLTVAGGVPTWATSDDADAIQNAIVDAKGDIVAASAADTPARLAVGTDNQRLVAASGEATGLKYVSDTQNTVVDAAGDLVYGTAADTLGRLAIGTAGQVLKVNSGATAPEWGAAGGGMTLIQETVASANSSISFGSIADSYKDLIFYWSGIQHSTTGSTFAVRFNNNSSSIYDHSGFQIEATTPVAFDAPTNNVAGSYTFGYQPTGTTFSATAHGVMRIYNYASTSKFKFWETTYSFYDGARQFWRSESGVFKSTTAISSLDVVRVSGSATISNLSDSSIRLLGVS